MPHKKFPKKSFMTVLLAGAMIVGMGPVSAATTERMKTSATTEAMKDQKFTTLTGTASEIADEKFTLTYDNNKRVTVNVKEWGDDVAPRMIRSGQRVTVSGELKNNLFSLPEIEAQTIHALDTGRRYEYSSASQQIIEEQARYSSRVERDDAVRGNLMTGEVVSFNGLHFVMRTSQGLVSVNTSGLPNNPASKSFTPRLEVGDTVALRATGQAPGAYDVTANEVVSITKSYSDTAAAPRPVNDARPASRSASRAPTAWDLRN